MKKSLKITQKFKLVLLILFMAGVAVYSYNSFVDERRNLVDFAIQHEQIEGTWVLDNVASVSDGFYILHAFSNGVTYTGGSDDKNGKGKGYYEVLEVSEDGSFVIEIKSDWYGYKSKMDLTPQKDPSLLKIYNQEFRKISDDFLEKKLD
jgi:hypothetical protein